MAVIPLPKEVEKISNPVGFLEQSSSSSAHVLVSTFNDVMRIDLGKISKKAINLHVFSLPCPFKKGKKRSMRKIDFLLVSHIANNILYKGGFFKQKFFFYSYNY